jgi:peptidoglycan hydrolase-like protein with peptidoglycan-binding domain
MTTNAEAWSKEFRRELQRRMHEAGAYDGKIDGKFGEGTKTAIEALAKQQ